MGQLIEIRRYLMAFEISRFSEAGLDLLSQISSSKALKIKNIYADSIYHEDDDLEQDPYWWSEQTATTMAKVDATISAISPIEGQARLIIDLSLKASETSDVTIRTVVITACAVESGVEGEEVVFAGISDEDGVEVLYRSGIKISTAVAFYFKFNNTANIEIDTGIDPNFVIHSELDRFVSCHVIGDNYSGENQTIYGNKFFQDSIYLNTENDATLTFAEGSMGAVLYEIYPEDNTLILSSSIADGDSGTSVKFGNYGREIMRLDVANADTASETSTVVVNDKIEAPKASVSTLSGLTGNTITFDAQILKPAHSNCLLGTLITPFDGMFTDVLSITRGNEATLEASNHTITFHTGNATGSLSWYVEEDFTFEVSAGGESAITISPDMIGVNKIMVTDAIRPEGDITPSFDNTVALGNSGHRYSNIHAYNSNFNNTNCGNLRANKLNVLELGDFPHVIRGESATDADFPVGSIIIGAPIHFIAVDGLFVPEARSSWLNITASLQVGETFTAPGRPNLYRVFPCPIAWLNNGRSGDSTADPSKKEWEVDISGARSLPVGSKWAFLSRPTNYVDGTTVIGDPTLLMRIR